MNRKLILLLFIFTFIFSLISLQPIFANSDMEQQQNNTTNNVQQQNKKNNQDDGVIIQEENKSGNEESVTTEEATNSAEEQIEEIPPEVIKGIALNYFLIGVGSIILFAIIAFFLFLVWLKKTPTASKQRINKSIFLIGMLGFILGYIVDIVIVKIFESLEFLKLEMLDYIKEYYYDILIDSYPGITFNNSLGFMHFMNMLIIYLIFYSIILGVYIYINNKS